MHDPLRIGDDVSKHTLDMANLPAGRDLGFPNDPYEHARLVNHLRAPGAMDRIVLEVSGGYEHDLALADASLPSLIVNPHGRCSTSPAPTDA